MLIVYNTMTGEIVDNSGTNSAMPEGPPDDLAYINTDAHGVERKALALLRLNDEHDASLVEKILRNRCHVDPKTKQVVIDGPYPVQSLIADPAAIGLRETAVVTYTDTRDDAPASVTFTVNGAITAVALTDGTAELEIAPTAAGPITVSIDQDVPGVTITVQEA